ncbi:PREDICTED: serine/arginine-rich splicing factor [Prunus dulcis]|uniref:PREDICTED: serine/arginine-rich splicing factor n=1 Tax=Prunus dulcis TaxID=3755 RepID=A0A5E4FWD6_PRUDU|nr:PREDICTED: serine/arginine-rich splicing factor [Prunus dulcis]
MPYPRERRSASPHSSPSPVRGRRSRSLSRSRRSRSRSQSVDASNPGNNLYVTGLSTRVNSSDLEKFFNKEGKVLECHLVTDPRTRESRGFGFVTMETVEDAERCVKYLNRSVLEGRLVTVEKVLASVKGSRKSLCSMQLNYLYFLLLYEDLLSSEMLPDKFWQQVWSL